jgi:hypothetical protein
MIEKIIQTNINKYLRQRSIPFFHISKGRGGSRQSKMNMGGWPDLFIFCGGRTLFIEIKTQKGRLSTKQQKIKESLEQQGFIYLVIRCPQNGNI